MAFGASLLMVEDRLCPEANDPRRQRLASLETQDTMHVCMLQTKFILQLIHDFL